jgi:hypothetical protein
MAAVSATAQGGAERPSPFRALFAGLRGRSNSPGDHVPPNPAADLSSAGPVILALPATHDARGGQKQGSWFEQDGPRQSRRVLAMEDFLARFRQIMSRQGMSRKDPLSPVLDMLGELLVHMAHLYEDQIKDLGQVTGDARAGIMDDARQAEGMMALAVARIHAIEAATQQRQAVVLRDFRDSIEDVIRRVIVRRAGVRVWRDRMLGVLCFGTALVGAFWFGRSWGLTEVKDAVLQAKTQIPATTLNDGPEVLIQWLDLMEWNRLDAAPRSCESQRYGSSSRQACTFTFWNAPPPDEPPQGQSSAP